MTNIEEAETQIVINRDHQDIQLVDCTDDATWNIEDVVPLNSRYLEKESDSEMMCQFGFIKI